MYKTSLLLLPFLFLAGCSFALVPEATPTSTPPPFYTATLIATFTPRPSVTLAPPSITPTVEPLEGVVSSQVNVRSGPDQNRTSLGLLNYLTKVKIIGKDQSGKWWEIVYKDAPQGVGWVTASFIQFTGDAEKIPVVAAAPDSGTDNGQSQPATPDNSPTPTPRTATVTKQINVRSGPASAFSSLGLVDANTKVVLTGRNEINTWVQIEYPSGPDGRGWVAALYLQDSDLNGLPYYDNDGKLIFAPTPNANPGQPSQTPTPFLDAAPDGDSEEKPAVNEVLSSAGTGTIIYSSELSAPTGDDADWVAFTFDGPSNQSFYIYLRLDCTGNGGVTATLEKDGKPVPDTRQLVCGNYGLAMKVLGGQPYMLVLRADGSGGPLRFVSYTLKINAAQ